MLSCYEKMQAETMKSLKVHLKIKFGSESLFQQDLKKSLSFDINICKESGVVIWVPEVALYSGYSGLGR